MTEPKNLYLAAGDVMTVVEAGNLKMAFGSGRKAEEYFCAIGDHFEIREPTKISGDAKVHVKKAPINRVVRKSMALEQPVRQCSASFATLELPDIADPVVRELENKLEQRGALLRHRLAIESEKLKG